MDWRRGASRLSLRLASTLAGFAALGVLCVSPFDAPAQEPGLEHLKQRLEDTSFGPAGICPDEWRELQRRIARFEELPQERRSPASLAELVRAVDAQLSACRERGRDTACAAFLDLISALAEAHRRLERLDSPRRAAAERAIATARRAVDALSGKVDVESWGDVIDEAELALDRLEAGTRGRPCEEELRVVEGLAANGSLRQAELELGRSLEAPCLSDRGNRESLALLARLVKSRPAAPGPDTMATASRSRPKTGDAIEPERGRQPHPTPTPRTGSSVTPPALRGPRPWETGGGFLALDVWQSAWGDFSELAQLGPYLRRNGIREVYLNPGLAFGTSTEDESPRRMLSGLVRTLRAAGVTRIHYLYAETNHPVGPFAEFLRRNPTLGMGMLADDSELRDIAMDSFPSNLQAVRDAGIRYAAYVTVEGFGNSGVSDETRTWAVKGLDEVILMSYFSCNVDDQRAILEPLLLEADSNGRAGSVKIAILMGTKSAGREVSCEKVLAPDEMREFIAALHRWAATHPSYGGIVLETNERFPRLDVSSPD